MKAFALRFSIAAVAALIGCRPEPVARAPETTVVPTTAEVTAPLPPPSASPPAERSAGPEHEVSGHHIRVAQRGKMCVLVDRAQTAAPGEAPGEIPLALEGPCHLLLWNAAPPARAGKPSDGIAVGGAGAPLAWRYPSARGATVVAVIGDAIPPDAIPPAGRADPIVGKRLAQGLRCAPSLQGVLLTPRGPSTATRKRGDFGVLCVEGGVDEKVLWMLAHD